MAESNTFLFSGSESGTHPRLAERMSSSSQGAAMTHKTCESTEKRHPSALVGKGLMEEAVLSWAKKEKLDFEPWIGRGKIAGGQWSGDECIHTHTYTENF